VVLLALLTAAAIALFVAVERSGVERR
jgi:hypothetical protein